jgi:hypothetical protein
LYTVLFLDDSKLADMDATPSANPVRVAFARQETEWQKKRREQSAQVRCCLHFKLQISVIVQTADNRQ